MIFPPPNRPGSPPRVVVTGAGIVTALGIGWASNAEGFRSGRTAFRPVTLFDVSRQRVRRAAEVDLPAISSSSSSSSFSSSKQRHEARLDRGGQMLFLAACEALEGAGWAASGDALPFMLGTTAGGMMLGEAYYRQAVETPLRLRGQPTRALLYQSQVQARCVAEALGLNAEVMIFSNACASGTNAIGEAWECIRRGRAERVLTGGYDALAQLVFCGFDSLQALSPTVCRPFDAVRDGLALGEGAAIVTLETLDSARRRGAVILGEITGYGSVLDTHHLTQPHPQGDAALASMKLACESAQITPEEVGYINAHGTGTPLNDSAEALAIGRWAGARAASLPVSSTKAGIGHLLGAAGAVEAVACLMALGGQWLPPEPAFERPDPACSFPVVRVPQDARFDTALSNSFGFGGINATLVLRRWS